MRIKFISCFQRHKPPLRHRKIQGVAHLPVHPSYGFMLSFEQRRNTISDGPAAHEPPAAFRVSPRFVDISYPIYFHSQLTVKSSALLVCPSEFVTLTGKTPA
jgi:hypothetical protein